MSFYSVIRKNALKNWESRSKKIFEVKDKLSKVIECKWQNDAFYLGFNHISIFCSIELFSSHITELLKDYRFDKYEFDQSELINEILFRYYSRILLISSEMLTDFQDLYIIANHKLTIKHLRDLNLKDLHKHQDTARINLANGNKSINELLNFTNKICKHKSLNIHRCNHHINYLFDDFHKNIKSKKNKIELGNINQYTSLNSQTLQKYSKPDFIVIPKLNFIIDLIINCYIVIDKLFQNDIDKFKFVCKHYEDNYLITP